MGLLYNVKRWTKKTGQPFFGFMVAAIEEQLRYEQSQPRCDNCGSVELEYRCGDYRTGVTTPDGGCETRFEEFRECARCGARQEY